MRKRLFLFTALLILALSIGVVTHQTQAANIASTIEPNAGGAELWVTPVWNDSATQINDNEIVVWDFGSSTGDDDNWVATTTTANTHLIAGVAYGNIPAKSAGAIVIRGVYPVEVTSSCNPGSYICSSTTAGSGSMCQSNNPRVGITTGGSATTGADCTVFVDPSEGN